MDYRELTGKQLDALREVSGIGMAHAATALSQMLDRKVMLEVPKVTVTELSRVPEYLGGAEKLVVGIYLQILGDARGNILLLFPRESAFRLLDALLEQKPARRSMFSEMEISALKEVGNILAAAYLNALGTLLQMTFLPSVPMISYDMAGAVVDYVLIQLGETGDLSLMLETTFRGSLETPISSHFFVLPDSDSLQIILRAIDAATCS